ncbi:MAG: hypothetical protein J6331_03735, partial [Lentisphaeria bacterium]|nr:hypothetical protein [Lentisphaeria bacterium]
ELGEDVAAGLYWKVISYDARVCRVKLKHERAKLPFRREKAEIEIKALWQGATDVVLVCGRKKVTVHFSAQ